MQVVDEDVVGGCGKELWGVPAHLNAPVLYYRPQTEYGAPTSWADVVRDAARGRVRPRGRGLRLPMWRGQESLVITFLLLFEAELADHRQGPDAQRVVEIF